MYVQYIPLHGRLDRRQQATDTKRQDFDLQAAQPHVNFPAASSYIHMKFAWTSHFQEIPSGAYGGNNEVVTASSENGTDDEKGDNASFSRISFVIVCSVCNARCGWGRFQLFQTIHLGLQENTRNLFSVSFYEASVVQHRTKGPRPFPVVHCNTSIWNWWKLRLSDCNLSVIRGSWQLPKSLSFQMPQCTVLSGYDLAITFHFKSWCWRRWVNRIRHCAINQVKKEWTTCCFNSSLIS